MVQDADGTAVAIADVWAETYQRWGNNGTRTEADGTYTSTGITVGNYRVRVQVADLKIPLTLFATGVEKTGGGGVWFRPR